MSDSTPPGPPEPPPGYPPPPPPPPRPGNTSASAAPARRCHPAPTAAPGGGASAVRIRRSRGAPPPPAPGAAMPGGAPAPAQYSVSDAFNYGWKKFQENLGPWILGILILFIGLAVIQGIYQLLVGGLVSANTETKYNATTGQVELVSTGGLWFSLFAIFVLAIPIAILGMIVQAQIVRAGLGTTEGKIELGKVLRDPAVGPGHRGVDHRRSAHLGGCPGVLHRRHHRGVLRSVLRVFRLGS